jgi:hypothetical protein
VQAVKGDAYAAHWCMGAEWGHGKTPVSGLATDAGLSGAARASACTLSREGRDTRQPC